MVVNENDNINKISLNLFVNTIEDITEYIEVNEEVIE